MNELSRPLHPEGLPPEAGLTAAEELLARELSEEWCGMESDCEETSQLRAPKQNPEEDPISPASF